MGAKTLLTYVQNYGAPGIETPYAPHKRVFYALPSKCILFPNWVDANAIHPLKKEHSLRSSYGISQTDKVILYSGNLGEKQGLENINKAAKVFRNQEDVKFVMVGSGGGEMKLKQK